MKNWYDWTCLVFLTHWWSLAFQSCLLSIHNHSQLFWIHANLIYGNLHKSLCHILTSMGVGWPSLRSPDLALTWISSNSCAHVLLSSLVLIKHRKSVDWDVKIEWSCSVFTSSTLKQMLKYEPLLMQLVVMLSLDKFCDLMN